MIHHAWTLLCRQALISQETNNFSLVEITEQLGIPGQWPDTATKPAAIGQEFHLVSMYYRDESIEGQILETRVRFIDPLNETLISREQKLNFQKFARFRSRAALEGIPITVPGRYFFVVERKDGEAWTESTRLPLVIEANAPTVS